MGVLTVFTGADAFAKRAPEYPVYLQIDRLEPRATITQGDRMLDSMTGETLAWFNINHPSNAATPELAARQFLTDHASAFGGDAVEELRLLNVKESKGGHHVHLQQMARGIPVFEATVTVSLNRANTITMIGSNLYSGFDLATTSPVLSGLDAVYNSEMTLGAKGSLEESHSVRLMGYRDKEGGDRLVWVVSYPCLDPRGDWLLIWDAVNGEHLATFDQMRYDDGEGMAFMPDPLTSAEVFYGGAYVDNSDGDVAQLNAERETVVLRDLTFSGGLWRLTGPYVNITNFEAPNDPPATSETLDGFSFTRAQQGFEDVNAYYNIDSWQRKIQELGFFNLQNLSIVVDPHAVNGEDNSYYMPSLNRLAFGEGGVDDAEDADVILHEYGHAVHHAAVSGNWNTHLSSISEGFGDYMAATYSARLSDFNNTWVFNWDGHNPFWPGRNTTSTGIYPNNWGTNIYTNGSIWCNTLWRIRAEMDADTADALVLQALFYQTASGTVVQAAQGLLQAEQDLYEGRYRSEVYTVLALKGFVDPAGDVVGLVTDVISGEPIEGAQVELSGQGTLNTTTDAEGEFGFFTIPAGDYTIRISAEGYGFHEEFITVTSGGTLDLEIELGSVEAQINPSSLDLALFVDSVLDTSFTLENLGGPLHWAAKLRPVDAEPFEPFENFSEFAVQEVTGDNRIAGITSLDGLLLVSGGNSGATPNKIYMFSVDGTLLGDFPQPSTTSNGYLDLTTDGTLIYGSEGSSIVGFTLAGVIADTIPGAFNPNRALAYDADRDWFWCADNSSPIRAVNRDGEVQAEFPFGSLIKGLGYFPYAPGGYSLYISSATTGAMCRITTMNPETGAIGETFDLPYQGATVYGSEVIQGLEGASEYWISAALTYTLGGGYRMTVNKLDWAVPYLQTFPRSGTVETLGSVEVGLRVDGTRLEPGNHSAEVYIEFLNGDGGTILTVDVEAMAVSAVETVLPREFALDPAYPNPFNPSTMLTLHLPTSGDVKIAVFDLLGRQVSSRLLQGVQAGSHRIEWVAPAHLSSGVYFLSLDAGAGRTAVQKIVLMK